MNLFETTALRIMGRLSQDFPTLDEDDIAAIIGNLAHECDGFATLQEVKPVVKGSRGGYGWAQWTGPRRRSYEAWCKRKGWNGDEFEANYSFLYREFTGAEKASLAKLQAAQGLDDKVEAFMRAYLRPGILHLNRRIEWARKVRALEAPTAPPRRKGWLWKLLERLR